LERKALINIPKARQDGHKKDTGQVGGKAHSAIDVDEPQAALLLQSWAIVAIPVWNDRNIAAFHLAQQALQIVGCNHESVARQALLFRGDLDLHCSRSACRALDLDDGCLSERVEREVEARVQPNELAMECVVRAEHPGRLGHPTRGQNQLDVAVGRPPCHRRVG
jgi:hypothetical protein